MKVYCVFTDAWSGADYLSAIFADRKEAELYAKECSGFLAYYVEEWIVNMPNANSSM